MGLTTPFVWGTSIPYSMPVYPGGFNLSPFIACHFMPTLHSFARSLFFHVMSLDDIIPLR